MYVFFLFLISIIVVTFASLFLYRNLVRIGSFFRLSDRFIGLIAAFSADVAEIASSFTAFHLNQHDLGFGIILGSNVFNLASMLGLSALLTGGFQIKRQDLWTTGLTGLISTGICIVLLRGDITPWESLLFLSLVLIPYFAFLSSGPERTTSFFEWIKAFFSKNEKSATSNISLPLAIFFVLVSIFLIFVSCVVMIQCSLSLGKTWNVSPVITGTIIIAILTSLPNLLTTLEFASLKREKAVISETFNSNSLTVLLGACLPSVIYGIRSISPQTLFTSFWLLGMTVLTLIFFYFYKGFFRKQGGVLIGLYSLFLAILITWQKI